MRLVETFLAGWCGAGLLGSAVGQDVITRHTLSIEGLAEVPQKYAVSGLELQTEVVEVDEGTPFLRKTPGTSPVQGLTFFVPEVGDEALVFFDWWKRIAARRDPDGPFEAHHADIIGYDLLGNAVARWSLEDAWPSKIEGPSLSRDDDGVVTSSGFAITLQTNRITQVSPDGTAPWPKIRELRPNLEAGTFTMSWRSTAGARYRVFGWNAVEQKFELVEEMTATGMTAESIRPLGKRGLFYIQIVSPPPSLSP